jgi:hypothetical protein
VQFSSLPYHFLAAAKFGGCFHEKAVLANYTFSMPIRGAYVHDLRFENESGAFILTYTVLGSNAFADDISAFFRQLCMQPALPEFAEKGNAVSLAAEVINDYVAPSGWRQLGSHNAKWEKDKATIDFLKYSPAKPSLASASGVRKWLQSTKPPTVTLQIDRLTALRHCGGVRSGWIIWYQWLGPAGTFTASNVAVVQNTALHSVVLSYQRVLPTAEDEAALSSLERYCAK